MVVTAAVVVLLLLPICRFWHRLRYCRPDILSIFEQVPLNVGTWISIQITSNSDVNGRKQNENDTHTKASTERRNQLIKISVRRLSSQRLIFIQPIFEMHAIYVTQLISTLFRLLCCFFFFFFCYFFFTSFNPNLWRSNECANIFTAFAVRIFMRHISFADFDAMLFA